MMDIEIILVRCSNLSVVDRDMHMSECSRHCKLLESDQGMSV